MDAEVLRWMRLDAAHRGTGHSCLRWMVVLSMPAKSPKDLAELGEFRNWRPEVQQKALELLKERENSDWTPFYCPLPVCNGHAHVQPLDERKCPNDTGHVWQTKERVFSTICLHCGVNGQPIDKWLFEHARMDQRPPKWSDDWFIWLLSGGRGSGKTRTGAEMVIRATKKIPRISLIAPTGPDLRVTMVEGESGILACSKPGERPLWEPSKKQLTFPNGAIMQGFSGEEPDRLRGPQGGLAWLDEPAHYDDIEGLWDNLLYGLRLGTNPKIICTTTPKPVKWMKEIMADEFTVMRRVSSYANLANLAPTYKRTILDPREGTRLGRQEIHGEMLLDVEGSLWKWAFIHHVESADAIEFNRIVVSVDPAGTANAKSDDTGIIVLGIDAFDNIYVLEDLTGKYSPNGWARKAITALEYWKGDAIVAEKNYGGDMVRNTIEKAIEPGEQMPHIVEVTSRRGKALRAEPVVALYERTKVFHVGGKDRLDLALLETEMTDWVPGSGPSPNRVDALVHGATDLGKMQMPVEIADPTKLRRFQNTNRRGFGLPA